MRDPSPMIELPGGRKPKGIGDRERQPIGFVSRFQITGGQKAERHWRLKAFCLVYCVRSYHYRGAESRKALETNLLQGMELNHAGQLPGGRKPKGIGDRANKSTLRFTWF